MTSAITAGTAKAAAVRHKAIQKIQTRLAADLAAQGPGGARVRIMIGAALEVDGPGVWTIAACDGVAALLCRGAGTINQQARGVLFPPMAGPRLPIPGALSPALKRVMTCADKGPKRTPFVRVFLTEGDRIELATASGTGPEACEAREWMPADVGTLAGRHFALDGRLMREGLTVAGPEGQIGRCTVASWAKRKDGQRFAAEVIAFIGSDDLWAYVVMSANP